MNICIECFLWLYIVFMIAFVLVNISDLFRNKNVTLFVIYSNISLLFGMLALNALYVADIYWIWKAILFVFTIDATWLLLAISRYFAFRKNNKNMVEETSITY